MSSSDVPEYVAQNVELWTRSNAQYTDKSAREAWTSEISWGTFGIPESEVHAFGDVTVHAQCHRDVLVSQHLGHLLYICPFLQ